MRSIAGRQRLNVTLEFMPIAGMVDATPVPHGPARVGLVFARDDPHVGVFAGDPGWRASAARTEQDAHTLLFALLEQTVQPRPVVLVLAHLQAVPAPEQFGGADQGNTMIGHVGDIPGPVFRLEINGIVTHPKRVEGVTHVRLRTVLEPNCRWSRYGTGSIGFMPVQVASSSSAPA